MIWESYYWKKPLLKDRDYIMKMRVRDSTTERTLAGLDKRIFIAFYSIRKLIEADKLSTANVNSKWAVTWYPNSKNVDRLNWHKIDDKYDLSSPNQEQKDLMWICNQIIHSYVFVLQFSDNGAIAGVFVSSDKMKNKRIYHLSRNLILDTFKLIGNDYPARGIRKRSSDGEWVTEQW